MFAPCKRQIRFPVNTGIAQLVEHRSPKPGVGSSSLSARAIKIQLCGIH